MHTSLLETLRCPFCGTALTVVESDALTMDQGRVVEGVLGCECCAYPVVAGIPVLLADDRTRSAMHALEAGRGDDALLGLLGVTDPDRRRRFLALTRNADATYRGALALLCDDAEGTWCVHRFSDPTFVTAEALISALGSQGWPFRGRVLDLCGGTGHLTRTLEAQRTQEPAAGTVLADVYFWKLWLASRFIVPAVDAVCCDANNPLPFARDTFSMVFLADAFPYIWHKRLLAEEMMRLVGDQGLVVMPHLHSALGENFSAGDTLTPAAYEALFDARPPRLFSDEALFDGVVERAEVDLSRSVTAAQLGREASMTLISSPRPDLFKRYDAPGVPDVRDALAVNPLYEVERSGRISTLSLRFPTPEYEEEFAACRRYMPERVTVDADLDAPIRADSLARSLGRDYIRLREQRVLIDVPVGF
jgi:uncharacterized protein YbaR (Trm112 family)